MEIAEQRQDWVIPEIPTLADPDTSAQLEEAAKRLAQAKGKSLEFEKARDSQEPQHFQETEYEYDTLYPSSDGRRQYFIGLTKDGLWSCECRGFQIRRRCKHLDEVRRWYEEQIQKAQEPEPPQNEPVGPKRLPLPVDPRVQPPMNTPMPREGVMVGGSSPPSLVPVKDPWAPNQDRVVDLGATVSFKKKK